MIESLVDDDMSLLLETNSENRPVTPKIEFRYTWESYIEKGSDWLNKATSVLDTL